MSVKCYDCTVGGIGPSISKDDAGPICVVGNPLGNPYMGAVKQRTRACREMPSPDSLINRYIISTSSDQQKAVAAYALKNPAGEGLSILRPSTSSGAFIIRVGLSPNGSLLPFLGALSDTRHPSPYSGEVSSTAIIIFSDLRSGTCLTGQRNLTGNLQDFDRRDQVEYSDGPTCQGTRRIIGTKLNQNLFS